MTTRVDWRMAITIMLALSLVQRGCVTGRIWDAARGGEGAPGVASPEDETVEEAGSDGSSAPEEAPSDPEPAIYALVPSGIAMTLLVNLGLMEEPLQASSGVATCGFRGSVLPERNTFAH